jgi:hypothetical protein
VKNIMMLVAGAAALTGVATIQPAQAAGCLSGAAVGGIAGHVAGHHHAAAMARERANFTQPQSSWPAPQVSSPRWFGPSTSCSGA